MTKLYLINDKIIKFISCHIILLTLSCTKILHVNIFERHNVLRWIIEKIYIYIKDNLFNGLLII